MNHRIGRTRALLIGGGLVAACGAVAVSGVLTASAAPAPAGAVVTAVAADPARGGAAPSPVDVAAVKAKTSAPADDPNPAPLGAVIPTGIKGAHGDLVFYGVAVTEPALPQTHFGIMAGYRDASGKTTGVDVANEFKGSDKAPGFHAVSGGLTADGTEVPPFGYYSGPAVKITAKIGGKLVQAHQAQWSQDPKIVVFWFDAGSGDPSGLAAFDASGHKLPAGNTAVGHG